MITVTLPWPDKDREFLRANHGSMSIKALAAALGRSAPSIRGQVTKMGLAKKVLWTKDEEARLEQLYRAAGDDGVLNLTAFAKAMGRTKANVCSKAKSLGLRTNPSRKLVEVRKDKNMYDTPEELRAAKSAMQRQWIREHGHPKGFAGHKHSASALLKISAASKAQHLFLTDEEKQERSQRMMKAKVDKHGSLAPNVKRGSWAAGWREIGGKRNYYRSRWEANYARYLEWLKVGGHITEWQHEPETFWFEQIKRGTRSYLPDFRVWENDGSTALHEVKGWMDQRSRTTLARMKKYHPQERIVLIDGAQYRAIRLKVMRMIEGWEDSKRDTHA